MSMLILLIALIDNYFIHFYWLHYLNGKWYIAVKIFIFDENFCCNDKSTKSKTKHLWKGGNDEKDYTCCDWIIV